MSGKADTNEDVLERLAPMDRWKVVEQRLSQIERRAHALRPAGVSESSTVLVSKLAEQSRTSVESMLKQLREGGAMPFKLGKEWMVREVALVEFYERKERRGSRA